MTRLPHDETCEVCRILIDEEGHRPMAEGGHHGA